MKDITQVSTAYELKPAFIRKCVHSINMLKPHVHRGEKNKLLFDDDALRIFDRITELKTQGLALPDITKQLDGPVSASLDKDMQGGVSVDTTASQTARESDLFIHYTQELHDLRQEKAQFDFERKQLEQQLTEQLVRNEALSGELKALPAGKTPSELRRDYEQEQEKRRKAAQIMGELKATTGFLKGKRRKELLQQLEELLS